MGEQSERRVIGYDVGVGGDGGPVYARADGAGESAASGLPAGHEWREYITPGSLCLYAPGCGGDEYIARASDSGTWTALAGVYHGTATPRPGESLLAAAQREAVAALWRRDGFGVGEVRGVALGIEHRARFIAAFSAEKPIPIALPGLLGLWRLTRFSDARPITVDARRVDAVAIEGPLSLIPGDEARVHRAMGSTPIIDPDEVLGRKLRVYPEPIATPASEGTGASATGDAVGLVREPFAPSARAAAETVEVLRRVGEGPIMRPGDLDRAIGYARGTVASRGVDDGTILSRALLTVVADRARLTKRVAELGSALDSAAGSLDGRDDEAAALRARVAELEALLTVPPVGSVAELLAKIEARESEERGKGTSYPRGDPDGDLFDAAADAFGEAASLICSTLAAPTGPMGKAVAEVLALSPDDDSVFAPEHSSTAYNEIRSLCVDLPDDDDGADDAAAARRDLLRIARVAIAGILACDAAKGGGK